MKTKNGEKRARAKTPNLGTQFSFTSTFQRVIMNCKGQWHDQKNAKLLTKLFYRLNIPHRILLSHKSTSKHYFDRPSVRPSENQLIAHFSLFRIFVLISHSLLNTIILYFGELGARRTIIKCEQTANFSNCKCNYIIGVLL